ncbi:MAG: tyrosine-type recombinase/integrase, partial [Candidatus Aenigmarchaeota archaeon]|nr:tyrosine-type recombinase/integrase [Candidatus Aenigmarchaeota archaeon]NIO86239.1 tyrosine-type recombinase/integrase [Candidatus Aminicenantes bacterium]
MAILAECPMCHRKQSVKNRLCTCGEDLVKLKRQKEKMRYWVAYRVNGMQRKEYVGYSIEEAKDAAGKRRGQKREGRIFEMLPGAQTTFDELIEWYEDLNRVKKLASYPRIKLCLSNFGKVFGSTQPYKLTRQQLENYQDTREEQGVSLATIDMELSIAKTMVTNAFDNNKVDGKALKPFRAVKRRLKKGDNARERVLTFEEYLRLTQAAPAYLKAILTVAFSTGMRFGEIVNLRWSHIDKDKNLIRLSGDETKEEKPKRIPINHHVRATLDALPRALHHDFVFNYRGEPIKRITKSLTTACKAAGIPFGQKEDNGFRFHDIRGTVKTNMLLAGVDKEMRDVVLGHSLPGMDKHYIEKRIPDEALT